MSESQTQDLNRDALPVILVTGFDPFDGASVNPSRDIALALDAEIIAGHRIVGAEIPTEFSRALHTLDALLAKHQPALVLGLGLAAGRREIALERVAINLIDARIADNAGAQPIDVRVVENAPDAYFASLPLKAMLAQLHVAQIPAVLSYSAGTFVCNQVFFALAHHIATRQPTLRGGFVHVPGAGVLQSEGTIAQPLTLAMMVTATRMMLRVALTTTHDTHFAAGTLF